MKKSSSYFKQLSVEVKGYDQLRLFKWKTWIPEIEDHKNFKRKEGEIPCLFVKEMVFDKPLVSFIRLRKESKSITKTSYWNRVLFLFVVENWE